MIHKNRAACDYEFLMTYGGTSMAANELYVIDSFGGSMQMTWGNAYAAGSMGFLGSFVLNDTFNFHSPWGSVVVGPPATGLSSGHVRVYIAGCQLSVSSSCSWTLTWTSVTVYLAYGSVSEYVIVSAGAGSMSGTGYDERLNATQLGCGWTVNPGTYSSNCASRSIDAAVSFADTISVSGGYHYKPGGSWIADPVQFDTSGSGSVCSCAGTLPGITGTNSFNVGIGAQITSSVAINSYAISCPGCISPSGTAFDTTQTESWTLIEYVSIKSTDSGVGSQTIATEWDCNLNGAGTSGSGSSTTSPATTTCSSSRQVSTGQTKYTKISVSIPPSPPPCIDPPGCYQCTSTACASDGYATLSWPTLPACAQPPLTVLDYDVSTSFRHGRVSAPTGGSTLYTGYAPNGIPYAWSDTNSGITATRAAIRWQDKGNSPLGVLYDAGSGDLDWVQTSDEGAAFGSPANITSSLCTGCFFDFEELMDFERSFYWQQGATSPYTIYGSRLDAQGNVTKAAAATTISSSQKSGIRAKEIYQPGAGRSVGLLYLDASGLEFATARDGFSFGAPVLVSSTVAANGFYDYEQTWDNTRWFVWLEGSAAPYTVYMCQMDAFMNLTHPRTATTVNNADLAQIRIKEYPTKAGGKAFGLLYMVSGTLTFLSAPDCIHFS